MQSAGTKREILLDPEMRSEKVIDFERSLLSRIVGQNDAVHEVVSMYQIYTAGMAMPGRPVSNLLFLGPTGSGKTRLVEASAEILFGSPRDLIKIDCAEFQHNHEIAKIIGSPPGYLGHRETPPILTQEAIDRHQTDRLKLTFILFDEIEKANEALWQLLLGVLDKGTLTLGDNRKVDMTRCVIFMTSNLGAKEMAEVIDKKIGFAPPAKQASQNFDNKLAQTAIQAAKRKFSPEFMNRLDKVVVFRTLTKENLRTILEIELNNVQNRIMATHIERQFILLPTIEAKEFLLREGVAPKYGARHLKRAVERHLVYGISNLIATGQIHQGEVIRVDLNYAQDKLVFFNEGTVALPPKRNLVFTSTDGLSINVDERTRYKGIKVGNILKLRALINWKPVDQARKLEVVGFTKGGLVVVQIDGEKCWYLSTSDFHKYFEVLGPK